MKKLKSFKKVYIAGSTYYYKIMVDKWYVLIYDELYHNCFKLKTDGEFAFDKFQDKNFIIEKIFEHKYGKVVTTGDTQDQALKINI